jgi:hypothetical protein
VPQFYAGYIRSLAAFKKRSRRSDRLFFAGDYLVGPYTEAALTSGLRAATANVSVAVDRGGARAKHRRGPPAGGTLTIDRMEFGIFTPRSAGKSNAARRDRSLLLDELGRRSGRRAPLGGGSPAAQASPRPASDARIRLGTGVVSIPNTIRSRRAGRCRSPTRPGDARFGQARPATAPRHRRHDSAR